jgi:nuclear transport factor 2 (NTF2) superfamily protein
MQTRPPLPPFTLETARLKVRAAEDAWNTRDPERVSLMHRRHASINDLPIRAEQRLFLWPAGPRPEEHPGLSELGC